MKQKDLLAHVTNALHRASGYDSDEISDAREKALNYYFMRPRGDEIAGRSQVVSGDLSAMVEANLSQMIDAFDGDRIVEYQPDGRDDENQAQLESDTVAFYVMDDNSGYMVFLQAIKDALLLRNGVVKVWAEDETKASIREFVNVDPIAYAEYQARPNVTILEYRPEDEYLRYRETVQRKRLRVEAVPIENCCYTENWTSLDLQRIPFWAERHVDIRSELIEREGFPKAKVNRVPAFIEHKQSVTARNPQSGSNQPGNDAGDPSLDQIEWYEAYVLVDKDGDGVAERRRTCFVPNQELFIDEETHSVPYAAGAALINPHRFLGISLYDKLKQTQDINTSLNRSLLDNANVSNKRQKIYLDGKVNQDDLEDGSVNANIRVKPDVQDVRQAVASMEVPDISAGILQNIQYQNRVRSEMGGAALDMAQANMQLPDRTGSEGLDRAYSVMEQLAGMMTRTIAESLIRNVWVLSHDVLRREFSDPVEIKRRGKWITARPSEWPERTRLDVKPGMSPGERQRKQQAYGFMLDAQLKLLQAGEEHTLVDAESFYKTLMDWARVSEIPIPEQYMIDPASDQSKNARRSKEQAAQQQQQQQQRLMDVAVGLEQLSRALEKRGQDMEYTYKYWSDQLKSEIEEAKIVGKAATELEKARQTPGDASGNGTGGE